MQIEFREQKWSILIASIVCLAIAIGFAVIIGTPKKAAPAVGAFGIASVILFFYGLLALSRGRRLLFMDDAVVIKEHGRQNPLKITLSSIQVKNWQYVGKPYRTDVIGRAVNIAGVGAGLHILVKSNLRNEEVRVNLSSFSIDRVLDVMRGSKCVVPWGVILDFDENIEAVLLFNREATERRTDAQLISIVPSDDGELLHYWSGQSCIAGLKTVDDGEQWEFGLTSKGEITAGFNSKVSIIIDGQRMEPGSSKRLTFSRVEFINVAITNNQGKEGLVRLKLLRIGSLS